MNRICTLKTSRTDGVSAYVAEDVDANTYWSIRASMYICIWGVASPGTENPDYAFNSIHRYRYYRV